MTHPARPISSTFYADKTHYFDILNRKFHSFSFGSFSLCLLNPTIKLCTLIAVQHTIEMRPKTSTSGAGKRLKTRSKSFNLRVRVKSNNQVSLTVVSQRKKPEFSNIIADGMTSPTILRKWLLLTGC